MLGRADCLSKPQSEGEHLLGLGANCPYGGVGAWTWEYRVFMGSVSVQYSFLHVLMLGV